MSDGDSSESSDESPINPISALAAEIMAIISALPPEQQEEAMLDLLNRMMEPWPLAGLRDVRDQINAMFPEADRAPIVDSVLDMINGRIALREMETEE